MANEQNLKPYKKGELSSEEAKKRGSKGGKASVESRRKKKALLETAGAILSRDIPKDLLPTVEKITGELTEDENTLFAATTAVMVKEALKGNTRAFNSLKDIVLQIEEKQAEREFEDDPLTKSLEELAKEL